MKILSFSPLMIILLVSSIAGPSIFLVSSNHRQNPVYQYSITPHSQKLSGNQFFTAICTSNPRITTIQVFLFAPGNSYSVFTFMFIGHCITFDGAVPNPNGEYTVLAEYLINGNFQGYSFALVGGN